MCEEIKKEMCQYFNFIYRFLHLDLVDFYAEQFVFKIIVEIETISIFHVFPSRVLVEDACFSTGQGLQSAPELFLLCCRTREREIL